MIDMMDVITHGEGGWLPQTNTSVFTNTITKNGNTNIDTITDTNTDTNDRYDGCYH